MAEQHGLSVRRAVRFEVVLPTRLCVAPQHRSSVRLSASLGGIEGWLDADLIDFSVGGLGLVCGVFVPRKTVLRVKVFGVEQDGTAPLLDTSVRVQRVIMTDRRPAYLLGTAFMNHGEEERRQVQRLVERLDPTFARAEGAAGGAHA